MAKKLLESVETKIEHALDKIDRVEKGQGNAGGGKPDGGKPDPGGTDATLQQQVLASLKLLHEKVDGMRADVETLRQDFDKETTRIADLQAAEVAELKALREQVANGTAADVAAALDEVIAGFAPIDSRLRAIGGDAAQPIPPVDNPPVPGTVG